MKDLFFEHCRRILGARGYLLIFDPMRLDTEDRAAFLLRWKAAFQAGWTALSAAEGRAIWDHVRQADFPESPAGLAAMGHRHRFQHVVSLFTDPSGIYQLISIHA